MRKKRCPIKTFKNVQKAWKIITQDYFKNVQESQASWKQNIKIGWVA